MEVTYESSPHESRSADIGELAAALAKAQSKIEVVPKSRAVNVGKYKYTYATLADVMSSVLPCLNAEGLALVQTLRTDKAGVTVTTMLLHSSGQWISGECTMPVNGPGAQAVGSAITYGRRYGLSALVGVVSDDDDDAQSADGKKPPRAGNDGLREQLRASVANPPLDPKRMTRANTCIGVADNLDDLNKALGEIGLTPAERAAIREAYEAKAKKLRG